MTLAVDCTDSNFASPGHEAAGQGPQMVGEATGACADAAGRGWGHVLGCRVQVCGQRVGHGRVECCGAGMTGGAGA